MKEWNEPGAANGAVDTASDAFSSCAGALALSAGAERSRGATVSRSFTRSDRALFDGCQRLRERRGGGGKIGRGGRLVLELRRQRGVSQLGGGHLSRVGFN